MKPEKEVQEFMEMVGRSIKAHREAASLTQEDMSEIADYKYFQRIEYGQKNITLKTVFKICKKLNIQPKDLFNFKIKK